MESKIAVKFLRCVGVNASAPSFEEIECAEANGSQATMTKAEILARWDQIKYRYPQQIVVVSEGAIIACSTFAVTVPRELVWLMDSAQDRLDSKIAHFKK